MAFPGKRPRPHHLKVVKNSEKVERDPALDIPEGFDNGLRPHVKLKLRAKKLWFTFIVTAPWLTKLDIPKAYMWCRYMAFYERSSDEDWTSNHMAQLRSLSSDLGMDAPARTRVRVTESAKKSKAAKYFED